MAVLATYALADRPRPHHPQYPPPAPQYPQPQPQYPPPAPKYPPKPQPSYHVPERNCSVDFEKSVAELCVPTLKTACGTEEITFKEPVEEEKCINIPMVDCRAEVGTRLNYFIYSK